MEEKGIIIGYGPCPVCGHKPTGKKLLPYKVNKKGHLYVYCTTEADGGCHGGQQSRSVTCDHELAERITKWVKTDWRDNLVKAEAPQRAAPPPQPEPDPAPADDEDDIPPPAKLPKADAPKVAWWDKEL